MKSTLRRAALAWLTAGALGLNGCGQGGSGIMGILGSVLPMIRLFTGGGGPSGATPPFSPVPGYQPFGQPPQGPTAGLPPPGSVPPSSTFGQPGTSRGGAPLSQPGNDQTVPTGTVFKVMASSFGPQSIAGKTIEDGNARLSRDEVGVALPSRKPLGRYVAIRHNGNLAYAPVIDVGPWFTNDPYWETGSRPRAEREKGRRKSGTLDFGQRSNNLRVNGAAIDLTWQTWRHLGVNTTSVMDEVEWWFADEATALRWLHQKGVRSVLLNA